MTYSRISAVSLFATVVLLIAVSTFPVFAQQTSSANAVVPALVQYTGMLTSSNGKPLTNITGVTFSLYAEQQGGAPLWLETQNVQPDATGHYTVMLGSTSSLGLPASLFASSQARWLGVQPQDQAEQPRIMLMSVPYALKALDAETIGGKSASSFVLAAPASSSGNSSQNSSTQSPKQPAVGGSGKPSYLAAWATKNTLDASPAFVTKNGSIVNNNPSTTNGAAAFYGSASGTSGEVFGVYGASASSTNAATGVVGFATATSGKVSGVQGQSASTTNGAAGVSGIATGTSGQVAGVGGASASTSGIGGEFYAPTISSEGIVLPIGVFGSTGGSYGGAALEGTADRGLALYGSNNAPSIATAQLTNDESTRIDGLVFIAHGSAYGGTCAIDVSGNLLCNGSKSAVVPVDGASRKVALYAVEAPENWFEDFGSARLSKGWAQVQLEPTFAQTVNAEMEYHVFLTPKGDCKGLYVSQETSRFFEVRELAGGLSNVAFDYRIVARRRGYENIRLADKTEQLEIVNTPKLVSAPELASISSGKR